MRLSAYAQPCTLCKGNILHTQDTHIARILDPRPSLMVTYGFAEAWYNGYMFSWERSEKGTGFIGDIFSLLEAANEAKASYVVLHNYTHKALVWAGSEYHLV